MNDFRYTGKNRKVSERPLLEINPRDAYMSLEYRELLKLKDLKQNQLKKITNNNTTAATYFKSLHRDGEIHQLEKQCRDEFLSYKKQYDFTRNDISDAMSRLQQKNGEIKFVASKEYKHKYFQQNSNIKMGVSGNQLTNTRMIVTYTCKK